MSAVLNQHVAPGITLPAVQAGFDGQAVWAKIDALDFSFVKLKLTHPKHGLDWSAEEAELGEYWYKRYMFLAVKYPEAKLVPNHLIDEFWHQHILDTRMYLKDSLDIFGEFHHHYPYAGLHGQVDYDRWMTSVDVTKALFKVDFDLDYDRCSGNKCTCFGGCKCKSNMFEFEEALHGAEPAAYAIYRERVGLS